MTFDLKHEIIKVNHQQLHVTQGKSTNKGTVLHLHGIPGASASESEQLHTLFASRGYRIISFNYPGLWGATGHFTLLNSVIATQQVIEYINKTYSEKLVVFAESFGGPLITYATQKDHNISHIFYRAPLAGMEYFTDNPENLSRILQTLALLVQAQIVSMEVTDWQQAMTGVEIERIELEIDKLLSWGMKLYTVMGQNDETLDYKATEKGYVNTELDLLEDLPHNAISRDMWIELATKADIFFQS